MNYRAYFFTNMYISSIQCGIQSGHVIGELGVKYWDDKTKVGDIFRDWVTNDKTMIVLNGGYSITLEEIYRLLDTQNNEHNYPFAKFNESEEALNSAITCVGIILPEHIWDNVEFSYTEYELKNVTNIINKANGNDILNPVDEWLINNLKSFRLAS